RAHGLPATSLAWGLWQPATGMTAHLQQADLARMARAGIAAMPVGDCLAAFDQAISLPDAVLAAARLDVGVLRAQAGAGVRAPLLGGLPGARRPAAAPGAGEARSWAQQLVGLPAEQRLGVVVELVSGHVATVLGHVTAGGVDAGLPFRDLGFDSLTAVELRN